MKAILISLAAILPLSGVAAANSVETELGAMFSAGNNSSKSLNVAVAAQWDLGDSRVETELEWLRRNNDDQLLSDRKSIEAQYRYHLGEAGYVFVEPGWSQDIPNDLDRQISLVGGVGRYIGRSAKMRWEGEIGYGSLQEIPHSSDLSREDEIGYLALKSRVELFEGAKLDAKLSSKLADANIQSKLKASLSVRLGERLWLRLSNAFRHNTKTTGIRGKHYDSVTTISIVQSWK